MLDEIKGSETPTKFQSPLPYIIQFRNLLFGKVAPNAFAQVTFFINLVIWFIFQLWSILSYFVLNYHGSFARTKGIDVEGIMHKRAVELEYNPDLFLDKLITASGISMIAWLLVFISLVLLWRGKNVFIHFFLVGFLSHLLLTIFYVGFDYFVQDVSFFDKIALLMMFSSIVIYYLVLKTSNNDGEINFFGVEEEEH